MKQLGITVQASGSPAYPPRLYGLTRETELVWPNDDKTSADDLDRVADDQKAREQTAEKAKQVGSLTKPTKTGGLHKIG